ncbi:phosphate uptake regulator PhoU [Candidatus Zixiibacteriota bacterium]
MLQHLLDMFRKETLLDDSLIQAQKMLEEGRVMFISAVHSLREQHTAELPFDIREKDRLINTLQQQVRRDLLTHLSISGVKDMNASMVLASIVIDLERIGDYTKNIAELAEWHPRLLEAGPYESRVQESEERVRELFDGVIGALRNEDENLAKEILADHRDLTQRCDEMMRELISGKDELEKSEAVTLALYVRYLKRVGAHLTNIASAIVNPFHRIGFKPKQ